jgi:hypothetical protein
MNFQKLKLKSPIPAEGTPVAYLFEYYPDKKQEYITVSYEKDKFKIRHANFTLLIEQGSPTGQNILKQIINYDKSDMDMFYGSSD